MILSTIRRPFDPYLRTVNPMWATEARGVIEAVRPLTPTASALTIRTNRAWAGHRPGQFVTLGVEIDGVLHHRCYSLTSAPTAEHGATTIEIAVQRVDGGMVSARLINSARVGDVLHLGAADGDFVLPTFTPDHLLFITGGSGITPVMGMLRTLAQRPPHCDVVVVHHAPDPAATMFGAELGSLAATHEWLTVIVVHTRTAADGASTRLSEARLDVLCRDWRDRETFVCGPSPLIAFVTDHWAAADLLDRLHLERFTLALPHLDDAQRPAGTVSAAFSRSNIVAATSEGSTLLDAAEANGVVAPYGCRSGVCHTCSTKLLSGCTRDLRDGRINTAGTHVQICVNAAAGDVALDL